MILAEAGQHLSFLQDYWQTTTDPAHIGAELTMEIITGVVGYVFGRRIAWRVIKKHDNKHHGGEQIAALEARIAALEAEKETSVQREAVQSSNIASIGYDAEEMILEVEFRSGAVYHYLNVAPALWGAAQDAPSVGVFLNQSIKPQHDFAVGEFVPEEAEPEEEPEPTEDEPEDECGSSFDHDVVIDFEDETLLQWHCANCGAEVHEEKD